MVLLCLQWGISVYVYCGGIYAAVGEYIYAAVGEYMLNICCCGGIYAEYMLLWGNIR